MARTGTGGARALRFAVVGAGMSGILCGVELRRRGIDDFVIFEKASDLGGTWRDNRYPGIACDVPSHVYSYSFAPNPHWGHLFSPGPEIHAYLERVAREHELLSRIRFGEEIIEASFAEGAWTLETAAGERVVADVVLCATGVLHHPNLPDLPGLDRFEGRAFHSARWPDDVTLDGRRVGVVGTGSTAVQIVTAIADRVARLDLFQRTAQWIYPQDNPAYPDTDRQRFADEPALLAHVRRRQTEAFDENFSNAVVDATSTQMRAIEQTCREHLETRITDPELRRALTPDYRAGCKRLVIADGFYEAIQRPNANLVTGAIRTIEPRGVRTADGALHELDVLVLATGFHPHRFMRPMRVTGRGGASLDRRWQRLAQAYRSVSVPDFPNFFLLVGPQSPIGNFSIIEIAELQLAYIMQLVERIGRGECREISATREATERYNRRLREAMDGTIWVTGCRSWYLDEDGVPASWPWTVARYREEMRAPLLADFELTG